MPMPNAPESTQPPHPPHAPGAGRAAGGGDLPVSRVLAIDDNPSILELYRRILGEPAEPADDLLKTLEAAVFGDAGGLPVEPAQFEVDLAPSGEAGYRQVLAACAEGRPYAVAFVDMRMPGGWDGLDTVEALWSADPRLQVVICTAYSDHTWHAIATRLGHTDRLLILKKPFEKIEVLQSACALAEKWRLQKAQQDRLGRLERRVAARTQRLQAALKARKAYQAEARRLATHDPLTGLPNRSLLDDRMEQAVMRARAAGRRLVVLTLGLERFRCISDSLGHRVGDAVLHAVAARLQAAVGETDTVARIGTDEFALLVSDVPDDGAAQLAHALRAAVAQPLEVDGRRLHVGARAGISIYPDDGEDGPTLLKHAQAALHDARTGADEGIRFFAGELGRLAQERLALESDLRRAMAGAALELHYQPQVDLRTGHVVGVEALLRWRRDDGGLVPPDRFVPLAEETGLIVEIGEWALRVACLQARAWHAAGHELSVAINVSAQQLRRPGLIDTVRAVLAETGLPAHHLELELTESVLLEDSEAVAQTLRDIRALGVKLSLDDFGTGYSSLGYLKRYPFHSVKIDRAFIRDVTRDPGDASLIQAIVAMARSLRLRTVAEGVETPGQLSFLATLGCDTVQGYLLGRPAPPAEIETLLTQRSGVPLPSGHDAAAPPTVLLVDDEPGILAALTRVLRRDRYRILSTTNPLEAFELLAQNDVGVIVCDGLMPGLSGVEFFGRVKDLHPGTARIMLSGYTDLGAVTEAVNRGEVWRFLTKPWDDEALRAIVAEAFDRRRQLAAEARASCLQP